jgi:pre-mRNA-processing factor 39
VSPEVFKKIRTDVRADSKEQADAGQDDLPPGEDEPDDHVRSEDEAQKIVDKIMSLKKKVHKANIQAVTARWTFEEGIKRPYFHVKPLERCQLKNWKEYLDYEIEQGDQKRILVLFERCLIACALYDDFWLKLIRYLEIQSLTADNVDLIGRIRDAYERACTIHHPDKPTLHIMWAAFEEVHCNPNKSAEILTNLDKACPNLLQVAYRRINLERRRGDLEKSAQLYEQYIAQAKNKNIAGSLAIKFARFLHKIQGNLEAGYTLLKSILEKDPSNTRVALQMIDLALQRPTVDENEILAIMELFMSRDSIEPDQKVLFAQRRVEFLEDFGSSAKTLQEAQRALQMALTKANEAKKKAQR